MRAIFCALSVSALLLLPAFVRHLQAQNSQTAANALVEGAVFNKVSGAPVKRAHVKFIRLDTQDLPETYADTDASGRFSMSLAPGQYRIWVERAGFSRLNYGASSTAGAGKALTLSPGQELRDISFGISPLGVISGRVLDDDGDPMQGAGVQVLKISYATGKPTLVPFSGTGSNDRGEYRAFGLPPGRYFLLVTQPGAPLSKPASSGLLIADSQDFFAPLYYPGAVEFSGATPLDLAEGAELQDVDIRLRRIPVVTLQGHVVSPFEDFAGSRWRVVLAPREGDSASQIDRATATVDRASGRFELHNVAPGSYMLVATQLYRGHALAGRLPIEVTSGAHPEDIAIGLNPGVEVDGTVEVQGGSPDSLEGATVTLSDSEALMPGPPAHSRIDASGAFRLSGVIPGLWDLSIGPLPPGVWTKEVLLNGRPITAGAIEIVGPTSGAFRIVLASGGAKLSGLVTRDGQPANATVVLVPQSAEARDPLSPYPSVLADDRGGFEFGGVRPGAYKIFAFEDVEPFAWLDPGFLKSVDALGQEITLGEGDNPKARLTVIAPGSSRPSP
ncbi:MAG: carboxypeptidase regulatory-like domain-containing protein [Acidobacteriaceae bacterium]|nr:carboxypeptidase regulatory-like domain-containing protein [Acidobacteriaceae bacterium]